MRHITNVFPTAYPQHLGLIKMNIQKGMDSFVA